MYINRKRVVCRIYYQWAVCRHTAQASTRIESIPAEQDLAGSDQGSNQGESETSAPTSVLRIYSVILRVIRVCAFFVF